jgi:hypothetical protein
MYVTSLWFTPNEQVSYQRLDFNLGVVVETATYQSNGAGYLELFFDTSGWKPDHYHLIFKGKSSQVEYCGHFDLVPPGGAPSLDGDSPYLDSDKPHGVWE